VAGDMRGAEEPGSNELTRLVVSKCTKYFVVPLLHPINSTETNGDNAIVSWFIFAILTTQRIPKGLPPPFSSSIHHFKSIYVIVASGKSLWLAVNSPISEISVPNRISAAPIWCRQAVFAESHAQL